MVAVYLLLSFPGGRLPDAGARAVVALTASGSALVWGALLATADRLPEFTAQGDLRERMPRTTRSGSWPAARA